MEKSKDTKQEILALLSPYITGEHVEVDVLRLLYDLELQAYQKGVSDGVDKACDVVELGFNHPFF